MSGQPRTGSVKLPPVLASILRHARTHLDGDVAYLTEFLGAAVVVRAVDGDGHHLGLEVGQRRDPRDSYCARMLTGQIPQVVPDLRLEPGAARIAGRRGYPDGAYAGVPVHLGSGQPFGALSVAAAAPRPALMPRDAQFLLVLAAIVSDELERFGRERADHEATMPHVLRVMDDGAFDIVFQPIIDVVTGRTLGAEALARFHAPPAQAPDLWFADAHRVRLGIELELAAVTAALTAACVLDPSWYVSVNASPSVVLSGELRARIERSGMAPERVVVEITEHVAITDYEALISALAPLRQRGVRLAVDDAGAGVASLHHIARLRPDVIKLDASLTRHMGLDAHYDAAIGALATMAERSGAVVIAEAVETPATLAAAQRHGLAAAQGYLFAAPAPCVDLRSHYPIGA